MDDAEAWPLVLPIGKPKVEVVRDETGLVREQVRRWSEVSVGEVIWKEGRYRAALEPVRYPAQWVIREIHPHLVRIVSHGPFRNDEATRYSV